MTATVRTPAQAGSARYSAIAIVLHWLIAAAIILQVVLAGRMEGPRTPESFAVTQLHKSIGVTILLLSLVRLGWRLMHPPAPLPQTMAPWERRLAAVTHVGFYVIMIGMPLTGWIMVSASRTAIPTLLYGVVPWPNLPGLAELAPTAKSAWHAVGETGHGLLAKVIYVLLALHVAGALKHQLFSRDEPVLGRMAPGAIPGRWLEPRILIILVAVVAVIAFGRLVQPPLPANAPAAALTPQSPVQEPAEAQGPTEGASADTTPATAAAAAADPPPAGQLARWRVAPGSTLTFETAWSGTPIKGRFDRWTAGILFSPEAVEKSSVTVVIDLASVNTGDKQRDGSLPAPDWFDVAHHPQAVFRGKRFEKTGEGRYVVHGTLDLRGVTKPLDLPITLNVTGDKASAAGVTSLDRRLFGVGQGEWTETDQIPAKVTVRVAVNAVRG